MAVMGVRTPPIPQPSRTSRHEREANDVSASRVVIESSAPETTSSPAVIRVRAGTRCMRRETGPPTAMEAAVTMRRRQAA